MQGQEGNRGCCGSGDEKRAQSHQGQVPHLRHRDDQDFAWESVCVNSGSAGSPSLNVGKAQLIEGLRVNELNRHQIATEEVHFIGPY